MDSTSFLPQPLGENTKLRNKYIVGKELGRGSFGIVYRCTDLEDSQVYAVKVINK